MSSTSRAAPTAEGELLSSVRAPRLGGRPGVHSQLPSPVDQRWSPAGGTLARLLVRIPPPQAQRAACWVRLGQPASSQVVKAYSSPAYNTSITLSSVWPVTSQCNAPFSRVIAAVPPVGIRPPLDTGRRGRGARIPPNKEHFSICQERYVCTRA